MSLHLVYSKLYTKFEQLWYHKNKLKVCLQITNQYDVQTYFIMKFWYIMIITCIIWQYINIS
jgi:hypothetical protein